MFAIGASRWAGISKLVEEAGEVGQVCGKLIATYGEIQHWDGSCLRDRLEEEMGDVLAAIDFVLAVNPLEGLRREVVEARRAQKLALFWKWHRG